MDYFVRCMCEKCTWKADTHFALAASAVQAAKALSKEHGEVHVSAFARVGAVFLKGILTYTRKYTEFYLPGDPEEMEMFDDISIQALRL